MDARLVASLKRMADVTDEWTEEKCVQLIREFRVRPVLWDQKDRYFFSKVMKPKAWQEIGKKLNISADKCKHKMIILMSSFRREKAKIMHSIKDVIDPSHVYKSTWFAFKEMAFLLDKDNERKRQLNAIKDIDEDDDSASNVLKKRLKNHIDTSVSQSPKKRCRRSLSVNTEPIQKVAELVRDDDVTPIQQPIPGPSQTVTEREEEIKSFTSFIGNKMKKYSDTTKNAVQQAICEVIFKADQNYYEPNCFDKFTIIDDDADPLNAIYDDETGTVIKIQNHSDDSN